ncbi:hypothetical protein GS903_25175 [Rhodococcus hoagii]|nr:hypothetical protein [Prescottella equi]
MLAQSGTDVLDEVVALFDQAISVKFGAAERKMQQRLAERGKTGEDRQALLDDLLEIVTDPGVPDEEIGALIRGEKIGWERLRAAIAQAKPRCRVITASGGVGFLLQLPASVHPRGARSGALLRRYRRDRVADRGEHAARVERDRAAQGLR